MSRPRWTTALVLCAVLSCLWAAPGASATTAAEWGPGFKACSSFHDGREVIHVFAKDITCGRARKIQKEYWLAPPSRLVVTIPKVGPEEVRLKRYPGWLCVSGTGGGTCTKGDRVAAYSNI